MKQFITVVAVAGILAAASVAPATQVEFRTPRQLGQESELVVDGKVASVRSYWNETRTKIYTEAVVAVNGTYKGNPGGTVRIVQPGGVVGNVRMTVHGAVQWHADEEVLLFLEPSVPGAYQVAGLFQGVYKIERDERSGKAYVVGAPSGDADLVGAPDERAPKPPSKLALDKFLDDVFGRK